MPSPLAHILAGGVLYLAGTSRKQASRLILGAAIVGSIAPDLDFLPGFLIRNPSAFHHGISHSSGFALLFGTLVFLVLRYFQYSDIAARAALMATLAYGFHAILDAVSVGEGAKSVPLLWPFSRHDFGVNVSLFGHFHHDGFADGIWSVVVWGNLPALARELTVMGVPLLLLLLWRAREDRSKSVREIERGEKS